MTWLLITNTWSSLVQMPQWGKLASALLGAGAVYLIVFPDSHNTCEEVEWK